MYTRGAWDSSYIIFLYLYSYRKRWRPRCCTAALVLQMLESWTWSTSLLRWCKKSTRSHLDRGTVYVRKRGPHMQSWLRTSFFMLPGKSAWDERHPCFVCSTDTSDAVEECAWQWLSSERKFNARRWTRYSGSSVAALPISTVSISQLYNHVHVRVHVCFDSSRSSFLGNITVHGCPAKGSRWRVDLAVSIKLLCQLFQYGKQFSTVHVRIRAWLNRLHADIWNFVFVLGPSARRWDPMYSTWLFCFQAKGSFCSFSVFFRVFTSRMCLAVVAERKDRSSMREDEPDTVDLMWQLFQKYGKHYFLKCTCTRSCVFRFLTL